MDHGSSAQDVVSCNLCLIRDVQLFVNTVAIISARLVWGTTSPQMSSKAINLTGFVACSLIYAPNLASLLKMNGSICFVMNTSVRKMYCFSRTK